MCWQCDAMCCDVLQCDATCCDVLQCDAVCSSSVLQCVAARDVSFPLE